MTKDKTPKNNEPINNEIDQETQAFIATMGSILPNGAAATSIMDQRQNYADICRHFHHGRPEGVTTTDQMIDHIPIRIYRKNPTPAAQVIYIHGGGFVVGSLDSHDDICAEICAASDCEVIAIDYRLAPEHKHPAALDDCRHVVEQMVAEEMPTVLAGDSAGGWLAAMIAHDMGDQLMGQVLIYPMLGGAMNQGSYITQADAPMLTTNQVQYYWQEYFDCPMRNDTMTPPMAYPDIGQAPPTLLIGAGCDPLFSDTPDYAEKLKAHHVWVKVLMAAGLPHGFLRARHSVQKARDIIDEMMDGITALAHGTIDPEDPRRMQDDMGGKRNQNIAAYDPDNS